MAFKQKMVQRLTGNSAVSASQLARETGVQQQNLSRWLQDARSLPIIAKKPKPSLREWTVVLRKNSIGRFGLGTSMKVHGIMAA